MPIWPSKKPGETVSRRWEPELDQYENILTATATVDVGTVTVTTEIEVYRSDRTVEAKVSGGTAGETARISIDATTSEGRTLTGVFYIGVISEAPVLAETARDVCNFALRKVVGNGAEPTAAELEDALERLNMMIAMWRIKSLDIGITGELSASDTLGVPDEIAVALKMCLRRDLHEFYNVPLSALDVQQADMAEAAILAKMLNFKDMRFDHGVARRGNAWDYNRGF